MRCFECWGELVRSVTTLHLQKKGKPAFMDDVPVKVCRRCGEEFFSGPVTERIGELLDKTKQPQAVISVPVFHFHIAR